MRQGAHLRQSPAANPCSRHLPLQTNPCSKELQQTIWKFNICILGMNGPGLSISWHGYLTRHQILKPAYFCKHTQPHLFWNSGKLDFILAKFPPPSPPPLPYLLVGASPINGGCNAKPSKKSTTLTAITPTIITFASQTARDHGHSQYKISELCQRVETDAVGGWGLGDKLRNTVIMCYRISQLPKRRSTLLDRLPIILGCHEIL